MAGNRWNVVWGSLAGLAVSATSIVFYTQSLFLGPMTSEFGWSRQAYFSAVLIGGVAGALATPLAGRLLDRFGVRPVLIAGVLLFAATNALVAAVGGSLLVYFAISALLAIAGVVQGPLSYAKAITGWFDRRRGLALAVALSGTGVGGVLVPPLAARLIAEYGWRVARLGLAATVLLVALPAVLLFVREAPKPVRSDARPTEAVEGLSPREAMAGPTLWLLAGAFLLSSLVVNGALANLVPLLVAGGSLPALAAAALSTLAIGQISGRLLSGLLLDRVLTAKIGALWYGCAMAGLAIIAATHAPALVLAGTALIGAAVGAELEMAAVFTSRFFGRRHFGAINGVIFAAYLAGAATGPLAASALVSTGGSYHRVIVAGLVALGLATLLLVGTGRYRFLPRADAV